MQTIQQHFRELGREPTDIELETIAQTWSEHCSHKTLAGRVTYTDENGTRQFDNLLKETIFAATQQIRAAAGRGRLVRERLSRQRRRRAVRRRASTSLQGRDAQSPERDRAVRRGEHGRRRRDPRHARHGPGREADLQHRRLLLRPARYAGRTSCRRACCIRGGSCGASSPACATTATAWAFPTVNGAIYFDERYVGNPLVFCGNVGLIPARQGVQGGAAGRPDRRRRRPHRAATAFTGRRSQQRRADAREREGQRRGGADRQRDHREEGARRAARRPATDGLFTRHHRLRGGRLLAAPSARWGRRSAPRSGSTRRRSSTKGCRYTEIWISEAQERMVLAVPEDKWPRLEALCRSEDVEAAVIGRFVPTGRLELRYHGTSRRPARHALPARRPAEGRAAGDVSSRRTPSPKSAVRTPQLRVRLQRRRCCNSSRSLNIASKEWVIRQYDHEVQGGSVIKPLVGVANDGPSDAAVLRPVLGVAAGAGDRLRHEPAVRRPRPVPHGGLRDRRGGAQLRRRRGRSRAGSPSSTTSAGATPTGPETLGALVRAAEACRDVAVAFGTPFISGKDSLNNEFSYDAGGQRRTIQIPHTLLDQRAGPGRRRAPLRDDGPEGGRATCSIRSA